MQICTACRRLLQGEARHCPTDGAPAETVDVLPPGARLDAYRIDRVLGEGGMGFVYQATHEDLGRRTAIKMLRPELAAMPQIVTRFLNEAKAVNLIGHRNVIDVHDYGDSCGTVYFVMEFLEGKTLEDLIHARRALPVPLLIHVFEQIARALAAAHARQIVHRDLKPANVFVIATEDDPCFIKLLDFGIAQLRGQGAVQGLTLDGSVMGTPQYMSPEQISGRPIDVRTDVWAVGVMLYQASTGRAPFHGEQFAELADKILHRPPVPAETLAAMPPELAQLIASCLERDADARCPSIAAVLDGLERVKRACQLDDDAIRAAVAADGGPAGGPGRRSEPRAPTASYLAGSLPVHQGADQVALRPVTRRRRRSGFARYAILGAVIAGLGGTWYGILGRDARPPPADGDPRGAPPAACAAMLAHALTAGDVAAARAMAERCLRAAITAGSPSERGAAVDALALVRPEAGAALLYLALEGALDIRSKAATALAELAPRDAMPRLRTAYSSADPHSRTKLDFAAALYRLGERDRAVRAALVAVLDDPSQQRVAAVALAMAGDSTARPALTVLLDTRLSPEARRQITGALARLGGWPSRAWLDSELAHPDAARRVGAAELLARTGDPDGADQLATQAADTDFARCRDAALALARLGDRRALDWTHAGLRSLDAADRRQALAILGLLGTAAAHAPALATLATDPDLGVRMTVEAVSLGL